MTPTDRETRMGERELRAIIRAKDWLVACRGRKARAHEYKRWAIEDLAAGRKERGMMYVTACRESWSAAKRALAQARFELEGIR